MAFTYGYAPQTPEGIARKRQIAQALMMQGMDSSPIQSPWQGVNRIAQALVGGYQNQQAEQAAAKMQQDEQAKAQAAQAAAAAKPDWQWHDGGLYNMNSSTPPIAVSQAIRQADDWKKLNERQMYRQGADGQPEFFDIPGNESGVAAVTAAQATKGAPQGMKWKDPANVNAGLEHIPGYTKPIPAETVDTTIERALVRQIAAGRLTALGKPVLPPDVTAVQQDLDGLASGGGLDLRAVGQDGLHVRPCRGGPARAGRGG